MTYFYGLFVVCLLVFSPAFTSSAFAERVYSFGVVPQQSAKKLAQLWSPILKEVSEKTGLTIQFRTAKDIPTFESRLREGAYDISYMNPYHYTVFSEVSEYRAIAKRRDQKIRGIIVVHKDSTVSNLSELHALRLAFPSPAAFAASILPQAALRNAKIDFSPSYVSSHDSVYMAVAKGLMPAGGGVKRTFNNVSPEIRENLKILWTTPAYTPHAIAAKSSVDLENRNKIQSALVELSTYPKGKMLLQSIKIKHGLEVASHEDWADVKQLDIKIIR